jgi:hypothetical protein
MGFLIDDAGLDELSAYFKSVSGLADRPDELLEPTAEAFVRDLRALPRPRSRINSPGRSHLVDSFTYKPEGQGVVIGWGVPYGPYVEHGQHPHGGMRAQPHFKRTWNANERRYVQLLQTKLFR